MSKYSSRGREGKARQVGIIWQPDELKEFARVAQATHLPISSLIRGAVKHLTSDYTNFDALTQYADYKPVGRPLSDEWANMK